MPICQQKSVQKINQNEAQVEVLPQITLLRNNYGAWSHEEQEKYIMFLDYHKKVFHNRQKRKNTKIFKLMSQFIGTRDGIQCRSHHMKQLRSNRNKVRIIILAYKKKFDEQVYRQNFEKSEEKLSQFLPQPQNQQNSGQIEHKSDNFQVNQGQQINFGAENFLSQPIYQFFYDQQIMLLGLNQQYYPYFPMMFYRN